MGIEPFIDASNVGKQPDPIRYPASADSRYSFLLKNRALFDDLREQLKALNARMNIQAEGGMEIVFSGTRLTVKRRLQWTKDIEKLVDHFIGQHLVVHKVPWNNNKIPFVTSEQLADLSLRDNTRFMQLAPSESQPDHIVVTALKDHLDRALGELTDMLTASTALNNSIPLTDAVYRSKPVTTTRDPKVNNHRSSLLRHASPSRQSVQNFDLPLPPLSNHLVDDHLDNLRLYQLDLLAMRFVDLARRTYTHLSINIDRPGRRVHLRGPPEQVGVCKNYFHSILHGIVHRHYKIGKEMAVFLSNPDTGKNERARIEHPLVDLSVCHLVEVIIGNLVRTDQVCAYEIERISNSHRRSSASPTPHGANASSNANSLSTTSNSHHKLVLYSLTRDVCDRVYDLLRHDIVVSSIMLDKDDKRCLASDSWHGHVRDLYSISGGFRRRRVLLQVKQNQLTLVGFGQDVDAMRKQIYDYFVENAISFYESD